MVVGVDLDCGTIQADPERGSRGHPPDHIVGPPCAFAGPVVPSGLPGPRGDPRLTRDLRKIHCGGYRGFRRHAHRIVTEPTYQAVGNPLRKSYTHE